MGGPGEVDLARVGMVNLIKIHCLKAKALSPENICMSNIILALQAIFRNMNVYKYMYMHAITISEKLG